MTTDNTSGNEAAQQPMLRWVKATSRIPDKEKTVVIRHLTMGTVTSDSVRSNGRFGTPWLYSEFEWLEEYLPSSPAEGEKGMILPFMEFLDQSDWVYCGCRDNFQHIDKSEGDEGWQAKFGVVYAEFVNSKYYPNSSIPPQPSPIGQTVEDQDREGEEEKVPSAATTGQWEDARQRLPVNPYRLFRVMPDHIGMVTVEAPRHDIEQWSHRADVKPFKWLDNESDPDANRRGYERAIYYLRQWSEMLESERKRDKEVIAALQNEIEGLKGERDEYRKELERIDQKWAILSKPGIVLSVRKALAKYPQQPKP